MKGKIALKVFDRHANLKYKNWNRHFWARGHFVSTAGLNEATMGCMCESKSRLISGWIGQYKGYKRSPREAHEAPHPAPWWQAIVESIRQVVAITRENALIVKGTSLTGQMQGLIL